MKVRIANHAKQRIAQRNISMSLIKQALKEGKLIKNDKGQNRVSFKFDNNQSTLMLGIELDRRQGGIVIVTAFIRGRLDNGVC